MFSLLTNAGENRHYVNLINLRLKNLAIIEDT